jgi:NTP pyrophosphatase (non-canonical NTP hydrolase)
MTEEVDIIALEKERLEWSKSIFPKATSISSMTKLVGEAQEVVDEVNKPTIDIEHLTEEYADVIMCLFDSAGRIGIEPNDIFKSFKNKLAINKSCEWIDNGNGTYSRIKK